MTAVTGILLAAGSGRRFGAAANKLLQPLPQGSLVAVAAAGTLLQALPDSLAVVRPGDHVLSEALSALGMRVVENPLAAEGMGSSLAIGIRSSAAADGWLITLADMPWLQPATLSALLDRLHSGASIVAPVYRGRRGHPVGFSSDWLQPLQALSGDLGARELISRHADKLELLACEDAGVLRDVDLPQHLYR